MEQIIKTITPETGSAGVTEVSITTNKHYGREARLENILFAGITTKKQVNFTITLKARANYLTIKSSTSSISSGGGTVAIVFYSNMANVTTILNNCFEDCTSATYKIFNNVVPNGTVNTSSAPATLGDLVGEEPDYSYENLDYGKTSGYACLLEFAIGLNPLATSRTLTFEVEGNQVSVTLSGSSSTLLATPPSIEIEADDESASVSIRSNENWTAATEVIDSGTKG